MTTGERLRQISGLSGVSAAVMLAAIGVGATTGAALVNYSGLSSATAAVHLLTDRAVAEVLEQRYGGGGRRRTADDDLHAIVTKQWELLELRRAAQRERQAAQIPTPAAAVEPIVLEADAGASVLETLIERRALVMVEDDRARMAALKQAVLEARDFELMIMLAIAAAEDD